MVNNEVKEQLAQIVRQHGQSVVEDPPKLQGLLKDLVGAHRREINVLMQALRVNVPGELVRASGPTSITAERLAGKLQEETGLSLDAAQWAVEAWGNAMGIAVEFEAPAPEVKDEPPVSTRPSVEDVRPRPQTTIPVPPPVISSPAASNPPPQMPISQPMQPSQPWQQQPPQPQPVYQQNFQKKGMSAGAIVAIVVAAIAATGGILWATSRSEAAIKNNIGTFTDSPSPSVSTSDSPSPSISASPSVNETDSPPPPTPSPSADGGNVYSDPTGLFTFNPPAGWKMSKGTEDNAVDWLDTEHTSYEADMDVRSVDPQGATLNALAAATLEQLKDKMKLKAEAPTDVTLGGESAKLLKGVVSSTSGDKQLALVISIHSNKAVAISMASLKTNWEELANGVLKASLNSWKWK